MKFELKEYRRNTPASELIANLVSVSEKLGKKQITIEEYGKHGKFHPATLMKRLGTWNEILVKAGLEIARPQNISNEELFRNIEAVWTNLGRQPKYSEIKRPLSKYSAAVYENRFGTWLSALREFIKYIEGDTEPASTNDDKSSIDLPLIESQKVNHKTRRDVSDRMRFRILLRDGFTCKKCGRSPLKSKDVELHVDHVIPWSKGGETLEENLETKCKKCNLGKGNAFEA